MTSIENDPIIGRLFDTPEKKAKWLVRIKLLYIFWIILMILGILYILLRVTLLK
jgi:hypothetical protein